MSQASRAFIGLGSNLHEPLEQVQRALHALQSVRSSQLVRASSLYCTPPWGVSEQPPFINAVAELHTKLSAPDLLDELIAIEHAAGRVREGARWGPRVLDLDLLLYGEDIVHVAGLHVPHPRLHERAFVLLPLAELAPDFAVPGQGRVSDLLLRVDPAGCERVADGML